MTTEDPLATMICESRYSYHDYRLVKTPRGTYRQPWFECERCRALMPGMEVFNYGKPFVPVTKGSWRT